MPPLILHIDDADDLPGGTVEALEAEGYRVRFTADPEEVMRLVEGEHPALVMIELEMEGCNGLHLMECIRNTQLAVPVLVVTRAPRDSALHGEAIALGVADFLTKPVRREDLLAAIYEVAPPQGRSVSKAAPAADLSGELADTPMPELLSRLHRRGANGVLAVRHEDVRVGVQLRNGSPVGVSSSRREIVAEAALYETFRWESGHFAFSDGLRLDSDTMLELPGDPTALLLASVLDASPDRLVHERLVKRESLYVATTGQSETALRDARIDFTPEQRELLDGLEGGDTLSVLLESDAFDEKLVYALWVGGWLELRTAPTLALTDLLGESLPPEPELEYPESVDDDPQDASELRRAREERERELEELARTRKQRERKLEELARTREERERELDGLTRARAERERELEALAPALDERTRQLEALARKRKERTAELKTLARKREERARELEELGRAREEREREVQELARERERHAQQLEELAPAVDAHSQELKKLAREKEDRARELEELARARAESERELEALAKKREERAQELEELAQLLDERTRELEELGRVRTERQQEVEELARARAEHARELEELAQAREVHARELEELGRAREERTRELEGLGRERAESARELKELKRARRQQAQELEELKRARSQRAQELEELAARSSEPGSPADACGESVGAPEAEDSESAPEPAGDDPASPPIDAKVDPKPAEPTAARPRSKPADPAIEQAAREPVSAAPAAAEPKHGEIAPISAVPKRLLRKVNPLSSTLRDLAERVLAGDDFQALGITPEATDEEARAAYEALLEEIPEIEPTAANLVHAQRAKRIRERIEAAFANLRDEEKRRAYSLMREEEEQDRKAKPSAERALEGERWFRKGQAHLQRRRFAEAVEAFGMASHLDPEQGEYASHLGYALYVSNPNDEVVQREAMEHVAKGIKRSPQNELSYVYLGRILKAKGDIDVARKIFQKALRIKPDFHPAVQELRLLEMRERKGKGVLSRIIGR